MGLVSLHLQVPVDVGSGSAADVSTMNASRALIVDGTFRGTIGIEGSDDGLNFQPVVGAPIIEVPGIYSLIAAARFVRITRTGSASGGAPTAILVGESTTVDNAFSTDVRILREAAEDAQLRAVDAQRRSLMTRSRERVGLLHQNRGQR